MNKCLGCVCYMRFVSVYCIHPRLSVSGPLSIGLNKQRSRGEESNHLNTLTLLYLYLEVLTAQMIIRGRTVYYMYNVMSIISSFYQIQIRYKGIKLSQYKNIYLKKNKLISDVRRLYSYSIYSKNDSNFRI